MSTPNLFVDNYRKQAQSLLDVFEELSALNQQYQALHYADDDTAPIEDADIAGHEDITAAEFHDAVNSVQLILTTITGTQHATNLYKMKRE